MKTQLNFADCMSLIEADGRNVTPMVTGEPGIGKTQLGKELAKKLGYDFAYIDMANMSLGDLTLPVVNRDQHCAEHYPNEVFKLHTGRPVVVMLDEWTKAGKEAKNMTLPLCLERRLGSVSLHPDSIVFATGNMSSDGVGDSIQGHQKDRFIAVQMRKPSAEEWINNYAINNDIAPIVTVFVNNFPQVMQSYHDDKDGSNAYIYNPRKTQEAFVTPRSLRMASDMVKTRYLKTDAAFHAGLAGAIGEAAAADLMAFVSMDEQLPPYDTIAADPLKTALPTKQTYQLLLTYNLIARVQKEHIAAVLSYVRRMPNELQGLFLNKMLSTPSKSWSAQCKEMATAAHELKHLFG